jgi:hypothetical protein
MSREDLIASIAEAVVYGNLGLFVGTGFSKAVLNGDVDNDGPALSWGELLKRATEEFGFETSTESTKSGSNTEGSLGSLKPISPKPGESFPELASRIISNLHETKDLSIEAARQEFKRTISSLTNWHPKQHQIDEFQNLFKKVDPAWIVTTNYDQVLESIFMERAHPIGPDELFAWPKGKIPIYHLHGNRLNPETLVITQEDYVSLFRPTQYRQVRLPILIRESFVILMGYAVGDVNVQTAIDWSENIYEFENSSVPSGILQVIRKPEPSEKIVRNGKKSILEVESIQSFLEEIGQAVTQYQESMTDLGGKNEKFYNDLEESAEVDIKTFYIDDPYRKKLINEIPNHSPVNVTRLRNFLSRVLDTVNEKSREYGEFEAYNQKLKVILDLFELLPEAVEQPVFFNYLANSLSEVAGSIGNRAGQSFSAHSTWESRKSLLPKKLIVELKSYSRQHEARFLVNLLEELENDESAPEEESK